MDDQIYECYKRAGKIAADARDFGVTLLKANARFLDVTEKIEARIKEQGAGLAFPVNIARNSLAAHYSPRHDDALVFQKGDVVKLDVGAHVNGYIADTAITVELGTSVHTSMIHASSDALEKALTLIKADIPLSRIGETIEKTIISYGYKPINNLMGHGLNRFDLHSGLSVPNIGSLGGKASPKVGNVIAIEPFATNGAGHVIAAEGSNIYLCTDSLKSKFIRDPRTKRLLEKIKTQFGSLPFAQRWCYTLFPDGCDLNMKKLSALGVIKQYPQLVEAKGGMVTQKEHTVIIQENGCEVIT